MVQPVVPVSVGTAPQYDDNGVEVVPSFPTWMGGGAQHPSSGAGAGGLSQLVEESEGEGRQLQVLLRQVCE